METFKLQVMEDVYHLKGLDSGHLYGEKMHICNTLYRYAVLYHIAGSSYSGTGSIKLEGFDDNHIAVICMIEGTMAMTSRMQRLILRNTIFKI
jgi:hypothetical protein